MFKKKGLKSGFAVFYSAAAWNGIPSFRKAHSLFRVDDPKLA
jgi:hypothetical protein